MKTFDEFKNALILISESFGAAVTAASQRQSVEGLHLCRVTAENLMIRSVVSDVGNQIAQGLHPDDAMLVVIDLANQHRDAIAAEAQRAITFLVRASQEAPVDPVERIKWFAEHTGNFMAGYRGTPMKREGS